MQRTLELFQSNALKASQSGVQQPKVLTGEMFCAVWPFEKEASLRGVSKGRAPQRRRASALRKLLQRDFQVTPRP
jgi:hypothetical protein